jgi:hypothetical protein
LSHKSCFVVPKHSFDYFDRLWRWPNGSDSHYGVNAVFWVPIVEAIVEGLPADITRPLTPGHFREGGYLREANDGSEQGYES